MQVERDVLKIIILLKIFEIKLQNLQAPQRRPSNSIERTLCSSSSIFVSSSHGLTSRTIVLLATTVGSKNKLPKKFFLLNFVNLLVAFFSA
jgi:hypothetical protein